MKKSILKGKSSRTKLFTAVSLLLVAVLFVLNLIFTYFGLQKSLYIDLTTEGIYSLTDEMKKQCAFIDELDDDERKVKITFCADPDVLVASEVTRVIYFMALQMQSEFENLEVETVNVVYNPTAVSKYKPSSLSSIEPGDIIVSYGDKYRVQKPMNFWYSSSDKLTAFDGEYKLATYIMSVTAVNRPAAYFVTGHGETYYDASQPDRTENAEAAALYDLLTERGLEVKTLNLSEAGRVPEDCVLLVINNPREDYKIDPDKLNQLSYVSEIEMLDRYLIEGGGSIMVSRDHASAPDGKPLHPALDNFLYEWGFDFSESVVSDDENYIDTVDGNRNTLIGEYDADENGYGYAIYGNFSALPSAADTVFKNSGYISSSYVEGESYYEPGRLNVERKYLSFMKSYSTAAAYTKGESGEYTELEKLGALTMAAATARRVVNTDSGEETYSYIFCVNSPDFFSNELLYNFSYANYDILSLLVENMVRTDTFASLTLGSASENSSSYGGKILDDISLSSTDEYEDIYEEGVVIEQIKVLSGLSAGEITGFAVALFVIPFVVLGLGIAVFVRRRFL